MSDNEKTGFKARELKSVQVDAVGVFLKLNIHKNHINKYNMYNQVGLVAVNVIGDKIRKGYEDRDELVSKICNNCQYLSIVDNAFFNKTNIQHHSGYAYSWNTCEPYFFKLFILRLRNKYIQLLHQLYDLS